MAGALEAGATKTEDGPSKSRSTGLCSAASRRHWRPSAQEEHEGRESERAIEEVKMMSCLVFLMPPEASTQK